jgi:hypothetical protein
MGQFQPSFYRPFWGVCYLVVTLAAEFSSINGSKQPKTLKRHRDAKLHSREEMADFCGFNLD